MYFIWINYIEQLNTIKMNYNLSNLDPYAFEKLIQSITKAIIGNGAISFGQGADGGREATFQGKAPYPSVTEKWDGYWVIQAKYKMVQRETDLKDFSWLKVQIEAELKKYKSRKTKVVKPDNFLFFTNIRLTAVAKTGGRDKASKLEKSLEKDYNIKHIKIIGYDDLVDYLNSNRDIATTFASFILPSDIIHELHDRLKLQNTKNVKRIHDALTRFLELEFKDNTQSKLDHAGKLTSDKVNLDKVFIDLLAVPDNKFVIEQKPAKFVKRIVEVGNLVHSGLSC